MVSFKCSIIPEEMYTTRCEPNAQGRPDNVYSFYLGTVAAFYQPLGKLSIMKLSFTSNPHVLNTVVTLITSLEQPVIKNVAIWRII